MKFIRRAAFLAVSLLAVSAPVASAHPVTGQVEKEVEVTRPGSDLTLFVTEPGRGFTYSTSLRCMPNGGDHSNAWLACYALKQADGEFDRIAPREGEICTKEYSPVILSAVGHWKGESVHWSKKFSNECTANAATAGVFDF